MPIRFRSPLRQPPALEQHQAWSLRLAGLRRLGEARRADAADLQQALTQFEEYEARRWLAGDPTPTWAALLRTAPPDPIRRRACELALERQTRFHWHYGLTIVGENHQTGQWLLGLKLVRDVPAMTERVHEVLPDILAAMRSSAPVFEPRRHQPVKTLRLIAPGSGLQYLAIDEADGLYECRRCDDCRSDVLASRRTLAALLEYAAEHHALLTRADFQSEN